MPCAIIDNNPRHCAIHGLTYSHSFRIEFRQSKVTKHSPFFSSGWPFPRIVAHRGGGICAPENTLAALRRGAQYGFHAVEFDVMLSKDSIPVLMHDPDFGRTVPGVGSVSEKSAQELAGMNAGSWFGPAFAGEGVPLFEQAITCCQKNHLWMNVEIKPAPGFEEQTGRVVAEWCGRFFPVGTATPELPLLASFSFEALRAAQFAAPHLPRGYLVEAIPSDWQERLEALEAVSLHVDHSNLSLEQAQAVKEKGFGLFCYTVNDPARAREIRGWGVDAFCTDRIDLIGPDFV